jgi:hypothetical protein
MTQHNRTDELDKETETYLDYYFSDLDEDVLEDLEEDDDNSSGK